MKPIVLTSRPDTATATRWLAMLAEADMPTHYTSPEYFEDRFVGDGERFAVLAENDGQTAAVLTGVINDGRVKSGFAVRPQTAFHRAADRDKAFKCLIDGVRGLAPKAELIDIHLWQPVENCPSAFTLSKGSGADRIVMLDLSKDADELFAGFSTSRRNGIRKAVKSEKVGVKDLETDREVEQLYAIHCDWTAKKGIAADNADDFRTLLGARYRKTLIAVHDGRVIAGTYFRFFPNGVVEYAANNSLPQFQRLHPNELLAWRAVEWACESGFRWLSMGASHPFLARFGGDVVSTWRYRQDRSFLRIHSTRERLNRIAVQTYNAMPETLRRHIKAARAA